MAVDWEPLPYQEKAVEHLIERSHAGLLLKPGLRKTSISLAAFCLLKEIGMAKAALVLAPLRVCYTSWPNEVKKWKDFSHLSVGILHGPKKDKVLSAKHDVYVINYEGLKWLMDKLGASGTWPFDVLIADEATKLKNQSSQRFKLLKPHLKKFKRRYILTGTPVANGLLDLFGQCYVMDSGETFGPYITRYREEFFYPTGYGGYEWKPKAGSQEQIYARLAPRCFYAHDEDWLQLPPVIEKEVTVELPPKARAMYAQMESQLKLDFKAGKVTAANAGVATMKLRQLSNGGIYLDDSSWQHVHEVKAEAAADLVEELSGEPALVTYQFYHELESLRKHLGKDTPHIGRDGVKPKDLPDLISRWNKGEVPVIIVSPASMSHGVDGLQHAGRAVIWASLDYSLENDEQLNARLRRSGQTERVLVARILATDTIDEAIMSVLRRKDKGQRALFNALKDYWS